MIEAVVTELVNILTNQVLGTRPRAPITRDTALLSSGLGLDSVAVLELVLAVENTFDVEVKDSDLSVELFRSVGSFADAINRKLVNGKVAG